MAVERQLRASHKYRNKLTELVRKKRQAHRDAVINYGRVKELEEIARGVDELYQDAKDSLKKTRQKSRRRSETAEQKALVVKLEELRKKEFKALRLERSRAWLDPDVRATIDEASERFYAEQRQERTRELTDEERQRGDERPYWGTKQIVEASVKQADQTTDLWNKKGAHDPRFRRWDGSGILGVQIQSPLYAETVFGSNAYLRIDPVDEEAWCHPKRSVRKKKSRTRFWMRIGSDEHRKPIWACWTMIMHRPLPDGAQIKRASIVRRMVGQRQKWFVQIYVDDSKCKSASSCGTGTVTIDLGWRKQKDGIRIGTWIGSDGRQGKFKLPMKVLEKMRSERKLRKLRDKKLDAFRPQFEAWLRHNESILPEWLSSRTKTVGRWRSQARFGALARQWRGRRFAGDKKGYEMIERWRYRDYHLWHYERGRSVKSRGWRDQLYCQFGAWLARQYGTVVWENFNIAKMAQRPKLEDDYDNDKAREIRHTVAVGTFRDKIANAFASRGGRNRYVSAVNTTRTCHVCGLVDAFDAAASIKRVPPCPGCGALWDQDENAAINMMAAYDRGESTSKRQGVRSSRKGKKSDENAVEGESHWARMKRLKREKDARK